MRKCRDQQLTSVTAPGLTAISMAYDLGGRRTGLTDETGTTSYVYDGLDRLMSATHSVTGAVNHGYDLAGRRTSLTTSTGAPAVTTTYDDAGRPLAVLRTGVTHAQASYDAAGRLQQLTRANGLVTAYTRDGADRLTRLQTTLSSVTQTDFQVTLTRAGQVSAASEAIAGSTRTLSYTYDGLRRLMGATTTPGDTYGYSYDLVGNRTGATVNGASVGTWTYDAANQVVGWSYDGAGNQLSDGTQTSTYDALGRLASVTQGGSTTSYGYTGDSHLASQAAGGVTTRFTLDTAGPLVERLGTTAGGTSTWYVRGWGQELSREQGGTVTWLVGDRLGSVRGEFTDSGTLTTSYSYDPFGTPEGTSAPVDYGFTGEPQDGVLGLVQLRARWYAPGSGRFLTRDPFKGDEKVPQSLHSYAYVHNDPLGGTDPSGKWRWRGSSTPEHRTIEDDYMINHLNILRSYDNPYIHGEYDDFPNLGGYPGWIVDLLNSATGGVFEIEPLRADALADAVPEARRNIDLLKDVARHGRLRGYWTGYPKMTRGPFQGSIAYDWNHIPWHLSFKFSYFHGGLRRIDYTGRLPGVTMPIYLVAQSPWDGAVAYWFSPQGRGKHLEDQLKNEIPDSKRDLVRQFNWQLFDPLDSPSGESGTGEPAPYPEAPGIIPIPIPGREPGPVPVPGYAALAPGIAVGDLCSD